MGRDFYIKFTNGGYWDDQFILTKKPDYERPHYKNYHTLYHLAAPFRYWGDGSGRENYILKCNGFHHDQKPLCSYQLTDFLRNGKDIKGNPYNFRKKLYLSVSEAKYNQKLKDLEKKLVKRLYTEPMKQKKKRIQIIAEDSKDELFNIIAEDSKDELFNNNDVPNYCKTSNNFNKKLESQNNKDDIIKENTESNKYLKIRNISLDSSNWEQKYRKKINSKFYNNNKSEEKLIMVILIIKKLSA